MKEKDAAFVEKMLPVLLSTGFVVGLVILSGQFMQVLQTKEEVNQIARAYMLQMETEGYLSENNAQALVNSLEQKCTLQNVKLLGSTLTPVAYGERITLSIQGELQTNLQVMIPFFHEEIRAWNIPVEVRMLSTAKH